MAFCTMCGKKLPDDAVFCPNCGHRIVQTGDPSGSTYEGSESHNDDIPGDQARRPYEDRGEEYRQPSDVPDRRQYGPSADPNIYRSAANGGAPASGKNEHTAAIIIICSVVFLLLVAAAVFFIGRNRNSEYIGYWESTGVDFGGGTVYQDMYGQDINGLIAVQINRDHSLSLISAYEDGISTGTWEKTSTGISAQINDDQIYFVFDKDSDTLSLTDGSSYRIIFERADGSITDSTIDAGSLDEQDDPMESDGTTDTVSGSGTVGDGSYSISVIGAEQFTDVDNDAAIRIYFNFTNDSSYTISAWNALDYYARQDGKKLNEAYTWDDVDVYGNISRSVRPGITIQCCCEFCYDQDGGSVDFTIFDYDLGEDSGSVTATYVPGQLPGAPAPFTAETIDDPQWTLALPAEGTLDDYYYVSVTDAQYIEDYYGDPAIRVYYVFTNNSGQSAAMCDVLLPYSYQDGISLDSDYPAVQLDTDDNFYQYVESGESITASYVFLLRNDTSPVEAEVEAYYTYDSVGQTYALS